MTTDLRVELPPPNPTPLVNYDDRIRRQSLGDQPPASLDDQDLEDVGEGHVVDDAVTGVDDEVAGVAGEVRGP